jgi:hypothetical protein
MAIKINFFINKKRKSFIVPSKLSELNLDRGMSLQTTIDSDDKIDELYKRSIISWLGEVPPEYMKFLSSDKIEDIWSSMEIFEEKKNLIYPTVFKLNGKLYGISKNTTVREFMEMDFLLEQGESKWENLDKILAVFIRPVKTIKQSCLDIFISVINKIRWRGMVPISCKSYEVIQLEKEDPTQRQELFRKNLDWSSSLGLFYVHLQSKIELSKKYAILFPTDDQQEELEDLPKEVSFESIWGFYNILDDITEGSIFEKDIWLEKPIEDLFLYLSYLKQKEIYRRKAQDNGSR